MDLIEYPYVIEVNSWIGWALTTAVAGAILRRLVWRSAARRREDESLSLNLDQPQQAPTNPSRSRL